MAEENSRSCLQLVVKRLLCSLHLCHGAGWRSNARWRLHEQYNGWTMRKILDFFAKIKLCEIISEINYLFISTTKYGDYNNGVGFIIIRRNLSLVFQNEKKRERVEIKYKIRNKIKFNNYYERLKKIMCSHCSGKSFWGVIIASSATRGWTSLTF